MTRIEIQGGGIIDSRQQHHRHTRRARPSPPPIGRTTLNGYLAPVNQLNSPMSFTIADSNLADFSDAAVFVHPDSLNALYRDWTGLDEQRRSRRSRPAAAWSASRSTCTCTTTRSRTPARACTSTPPRATTPRATSAYEAVILNNTFYNDGYGIQTDRPGPERQPERLAIRRRRAGDEQHLRRLRRNDRRSTSEGQAGVQPAPVQPVLQQHRQHRLDHQRRRLRRQRRGDLRRSRSSSGRSAPVDATAQNFELAADLAGDQRGPQRDRAARRRATRSTRRSTLDARAAASSRTRTDPTTLTVESDDVPGKARPVRRVRRLRFSLQFIDSTIRGRSSPCRARAIFSFPDEWQPVLTTDPNGYSSPS